jgi:hypothetical protein
MKAWLYAFLATFTICLNVLAQKDSAVYPSNARVVDGIYLNYADFRQNKSIVKEQIVSDLDKEQLEFISKTVAAEKFSFRTNETTVTVESKNVWGYVQNNTFYVNYRGEFYRIPVFGSISYLVASVVVVNPGFYDPRFGYSVGSTTTREIRELLMNFYDGQLVEFTMDAAEQLLQRDKDLFAEYKDLSRRKQKEQIYRYIRKFNESHPVYFLR